MTTQTPTPLPTKRRVAALTADGRGVIVEEPVPELPPGHLLIRTRRSMISAGTHLGNVRAKRAQGAGPDADAAAGHVTPIGYQCVGEVVAVGTGVTRFEPGQRVAAFGPGAKHSGWNVVPQNLCAVVPTEVCDDDASGVNVLLTALQAVRRSEPVFGEYLLVVGMGIVGQLSAQIGQIAGYRVMGWDTLPLRLEIAQRWGIEGVHRVPASDTQAVVREFTASLGFDAAILAFGGDGSDTLTQVGEVMRTTPDGHQEGRVVLPGGVTTTARWGAALGNLDLRSSARTGPGYHDSEWEVGARDYPKPWVRWDTQTNLELALRYLAAGRLRVEPLLTHHFPLDEFAAAVDLLADEPESALGVVLDLDE